ncbi:hypothetical protein A203_21720 [Chromobacterium violaceum]
MVRLPALMPARVVLLSWSDAAMAMPDTPPLPAVTLTLLAVKSAWLSMSFNTSAPVCRLFLPSCAALSVLAISAPFSVVVPFTFNWKPPSPAWMPDWRCTLA